MLKNFAIVILLAAVAAGSYVIYGSKPKDGYFSGSASGEPEVVVNWVAAAPGRVEPRSGEMPG